MMFWERSFHKQNQFKNNESYGNLSNTGEMMSLAIPPITFRSTGFSSFKMSNQFSFKNAFVVSLSRGSLPLNKCANCIHSLESDQSDTYIVIPLNAFRLGLRMTIQLPGR